MSWEMVLPKIQAAKCALPTRLEFDWASVLSYQGTCDPWPGSRSFLSTNSGESAQLRNSDGSKAKSLFEYSMVQFVSTHAVSRSIQRISSLHEAPCFINGPMGTV